MDPWIGRPIDTLAIAMPRRLAGFVAALLGGAALVDAQHGPYKYCCDLQKCHNVTATCAQIPACAADCLGAGNGSAVTGISDTCSPPAALPGLDYACFAAHLSGRAPAAPSLIGQVCGQAYAPGRQPAPDAWIRFGDCRATCPGWDLPLPASSLASTGPVVMLMQYIVPVAVFCLTVPRRRRWAAPDWMFASPHETANTPVQLLLLWPARLAAVLVLAALVVTFDLVVWIFTTFAAAGPILVGGITELVLDVAVLRHMEESPDDNSSNSNNRKRIDDEKPLTADERVELTVVVLCGNLDDSVGSPREKITVLLKEQQQQPQQQQPAREGSVPDNAAPNTPATTPATQARLAALLRAQGTFGSLVGAPVLFFVGSFVVALTGLSEHIGDNGTALSLAFGMWWMVLVQVTVVSSCTLASNNPSTVQGIVGAYSATERHPVYLVRRLAMTSVYDSVFMPVTLWDRGRMKTRWLRRTDAWERHAWLQRRLTIGPLTALVLIPLAAFALVLVPTALAFLVSYTTPKICVSCRCVPPPVRLFVPVLPLLLVLPVRLVLLSLTLYQVHDIPRLSRLPGRTYRGQRLAHLLRR